MDAYLDELALEAAQAIRALEWRVYPGGPDQRTAAVQVAVREALDKARRDPGYGPFIAEIDDLVRRFETYRIEGCEDDDACPGIARDLRAARVRLGRRLPHLPPVPPTVEQSQGWEDPADEVEKAGMS